MRKLSGKLTSVNAGQGLAGLNASYSTRRLPMVRLVDVAFEPALVQPPQIGTAVWLTSRPAHWESVISELSVEDATTI